MILSQPRILRIRRNITDLFPEDVRQVPYDGFVMMPVLPTFGIDDDVPIGWWKPFESPVRLPVLKKASESAQRSAVDFVSADLPVEDAGEELSAAARSSGSA